MTYFQQNCNNLIGLFLMIVGICTLAFPSKFGNLIFGINTKWTRKNETVWDAGQELFAKAIIIIGLIFFVISKFEIREKIPSFSMILLLIVLWNCSKYFVHKTLERKYPNCP